MGRPSFVVGRPERPNARTPERLITCPSVQIFVDRAQAAFPGFALDDANAEDVARLCQRLEGLPLAIELAAGWSATHSPAGLLAGLSRYLRRPGERSGRAGDRHRSVQDAIDWSYGLLAPALQQFFRCLAVFRGGWRLEAADAISDEPGAADFLWQLEGHSLVTAVHGPRDTRFHMLELTRAYALAQLAPAERAQMEERHARHYLDWAKEGGRALEGAAQAEVLDRLAAEHENLRAALAWSQRAAGDPHLGLRLAGALGRYWVMRGHWQEGRRTLAALLRQTEAPAPDLGRARALTWLACLAALQGDDEPARAAIEEAVPLWRRRHAGTGLAHALSVQALVYQLKGEYAAARACCRESLARYRAQYDRAGEAAVLAQRGAMARTTGDHGRARADLQKALEIHRALGNTGGAANALFEGGLVEYRLQQYDAAQPLFEESLALWRCLGDLPGIARALNGLGLVAEERRQHEAARAFFEESLAISRDLGDAQSVATLLHELGLLASSTGDYTLARQLCAESLALNRRLKRRWGTALSLTGLGRVAAKAEAWDEAYAHYAEALRAWHHLKLPERVARVLDALADISAARAEWERAVRLAATAEAARSVKQSSSGVQSQPALSGPLAAACAALGEAQSNHTWKEGLTMRDRRLLRYVRERLSGRLGSPQQDAGGE